MRTLLVSLLALVLMSVSVMAQVTCPVEKELGFQSLFNGKNLDGWLDPHDQYYAADGMIVCKPKGGGNLFTKDRFANFIFRFDFKLGPNANSGVSIRTETEGDPSFTVGAEIQILDDSGDEYKDLHDYQYHGSLYGVVPAKRGSLKPVGEWNTEEILCDGTHVKVTVNGQIVVDAKTDEIKEYPDHREHQGLLKKEGHLAFLGHDTDLKFRNLRILPLKEEGDSKAVLEKEKELTKNAEKGDKSDK